MSNKINVGNVQSTIRKYKNKPLYLIIFVIFLVGAYFYNQSLYTNDTVILNRCIDGDTANFDINGESTAVRFLGIDTPEYTTEKEKYGYEASTYTCDALKHADTIILEYEPDNKTDKYDRTLAWVFVDDELLQEQLLLQGLAEVKYIYGDYKYTDRLYDAQNIAKSKKLHLWK